MTATSPGATDEHLVGAAQGGSHDAFAALFRRYRPEIARYAGRILGDDVRAEDVVQETFLSALRGMRTLDRPEGFRPWLYRIAHNACVDQMRRRGRSEEVLFDAQVMPPSEEIRLFRQADSSETALAQKEEFRNLRQALIDLPEAQAQILVLRELEGLSYEEIAARMGISHSAVESMLFRARRSLRAEYGEIATGERCRRMRGLMAQAVEGVGTRRDRVTLVRHARGCAACRRDAFVMGLGPLVDIDRRGGVRSTVSKVAALFPLPGFLNRRSEETGQLTAGSSGGLSFAAHAQSALTHVSISAGTSVEHAATAIQKAAAVVAAAAVVGGGGFVAEQARTHHHVSPPAIVKDSKSSRAHGLTPARPGALFTSPLPLSLAPQAGGPAATPTTTSASSPEPTATAAPAEQPASSDPAPTEEGPAAESAQPTETVTFDISSTAPEPAAEAPAEAPPADPPVAEAPPEPAPGEQPPPDAEPAPVPNPGSGGAQDPGTDPGPSADSGGSGTIN